MSAGPSGAQYGLAGPDSSLVDSMVLDRLAEDSGMLFQVRFSHRYLIYGRFLPPEGSDDEAPRHYQLLPLPKKDASPPSTPLEHTPGVNQEGKPETGSMEVDSGECKSNLTP